MTLELPWPPSVNTYWRRAGHRMHISHQGREYRGNVAAACAMQATDRLGAARVRLTITAHPPDRRRRDLDNLNKAVLDALVFARVFDDDSQVDDLRIARGEPVKEGRLSVTVEVMRGQVAA